MRKSGAGTASSPVPTETPGKHGDEAVPAPFSNRPCPAATPGQAPSFAAETPNSFRYSLCREAACWVLFFQDGRAYLKHEIGLQYVSYLLRPPNEAVSGATLFSKFHPQSPKTCGITSLALPDTGGCTDLSDDTTISEEDLDKDTDRILAAHRAKAEELRGIVQDPDALPSDKEFARDQLRQITAFLGAAKRTARDPNTCAGKRVRKSIQRLCDNLARPEPGPNAPDPVVLEFAGYVAQHILGPSRRYTVAKKGANVRVARGELAGQLIFECPPGHCWSVRA